jgi:hypothetical protein
MVFIQLRILNYELRVFIVICILPIILQSSSAGLLNHLQFPKVYCLASVYSIMNFKLRITAFYSDLYFADYFAEFFCIL